MQTLVLVRHGATAWNQNGYCQGRRDVPLSERGRAQALLLRSALEDFAFERAYASPLARARETARLLGHEPEVLEELTEIDRGHWEGHEAAEIRRRWGRLCKVWYDDPKGLAMPGGETFDDLWERVGRVVDRLQACGARCALVCGHKATNRVLIAQALGRTTRGVWRIPQPQACWSALVREDPGAAWRAERIGEAGHLPAEMRSDS